MLLNGTFSSPVVIKYTTCYNIWHYVFCKHTHTHTHTHAHTHTRARARVLIFQILRKTAIIFLNNYLPKCVMIYRLIRGYLNFA